MKKIKVAKAEKNGVKKEDLINEATILQQLNHVHIVRYFVCFKSQQGRFFNIVMELVTGGSLADKVTVTPAPSSQQIFQWVFQIAQALKYMHERKPCIQHRDIKPDNILLTHDSNVKIADMGLACVVTTSVVAQTKVGTSAYASYEKHQGKTYDGRDDVWGLGCIIVELLTCTKLKGPISMPDDAEVRRARDRLISNATIKSTFLGQVLHRVLSPQQNTRATSTQFVTVLEKELTDQKDRISKARAKVAAKLEAESKPPPRPWQLWGNPIPPLVWDLIYGTVDAKGNAADALRNLATNNADNKITIAQAGAIPPLVQLLQSGTDTTKEKSAGVLRNLAVNADARKQMKAAGVKSSTEFGYSKGVWSGGGAW